MNIFSKISSLMPVSNSSYKGLEKKHQCALQELESARQTEKQLVINADEAKLDMEGQVTKIAGEVANLKEEVVFLEAWVTKSEGLIKTADETIASMTEMQTRLLDEMSTRHEETLLLEGAFADLKADFRNENESLKAQVGQKEQEIIAMKAKVTKSENMISSFRAAFRTMGRILGE